MPAIVAIYRPYKEPNYGFDDVSVHLGPDRGGQGRSKTSSPKGFKPRKALGPWAKGGPSTPSNGPKLKFWSGGKPKAVDFCVHDPQEDTLPSGRDH